MNKSKVMLLVIILSTTLALKNDSNPIQTALAGMALIEKIEQFCQKNTKDEDKDKKKGSKKTGK